MATVRYYLDKRRIKNDLTYPIKIRLIHTCVSMISTQFCAKEIEWAGTEYSKYCSNYKARNMALRTLINKVETLIMELGQEGKLNRMPDKLLVEYIKNCVNGRETHKLFIEYLDEFIGTKTKEGTKTVYTTTRNKIIAFDPGCTLETIDVKWLSRFERWMKASGMKVNAYAIHLRNIRAVFNYCLDNEYTTAYPFRRFTVKKESTRKRALSVEQLRTLRDFPCEEYQEKYRDMFMLMFYLIGINAADLFLAKKNAIVNGRLEYRRAKTGRLYSILVPKEAMAIISRYKGKKYLLNVMDEFENYKNFLHRIDIVLKQIGDLKRVGKGGKKVRTPLFPDLSSYWSRHTWATLAASLDIPKDTIAAALGHGGNTVTDIYIDFDMKKVDEANRKVIDYVNGV